MVKCVSSSQKMHTGLPIDMCSPTQETHISSDMSSPM